MFHFKIRPLYLTLILIIWLLLFFFAGCKKSPVNDNNVEEPEFLVPLDVGNYWEYIGYTFSGDDIIEGLTDSFRVEITDKMTVNYEGESYDAAVQSIFYPVWNQEPDIIKWLYWNGENGLYLLGGISQTDMLIKKILYFNYPVEVGEEWMYPRPVFDMLNLEFFIYDTLTITCVGKNEPFETRAGTFKCYVYKYTRISSDDAVFIWDYYFYYAPGIGQVGSIIRDEIAHVIKYKQVLIKYNVKTIN